MKYPRRLKGFTGAILRYFIIGLSFCCIFAISYSLNQAYLQRAADLEEVIVLKRDLLPGSLVSIDDINLAQRPVLGLGKDYLQDINDFLASGDWYIGPMGLGKGDVLRPSRLKTNSDTEDNLLKQVSRNGKRLIAVDTNLTRSCASWLIPGARVDGLVYIKGKEGFETIPDQIIGPQDDPNLRNLLVVDKKNSSGAVLEQDEEATLGKDYLPVVVTLMLDKGEEEKAKALICYNEQGKIYFSPIAWNQEFFNEVDGQ